MAAKKSSLKITTGLQIGLKDNEVSRAFTELGSASTVSPRGAYPILTKLCHTDTVNKAKLVLSEDGSFTFFGCTFNCFH